MQEVAYTLNSYNRVVLFGVSFYEVQTLAICGEGKIGGLLKWKKVCGVYDCEKAISLMEGRS